MKLDKGVKQMSFSERGQEIARLRRLIRWHKTRKGNARCFHNDTTLYNKTLPEQSRRKGVMDLEPQVHERMCRQYIRRQQCCQHGCTGVGKLKPKGRK